MFDQIVHYNGDKKFYYWCNDTGDFEVNKCGEIKQKRKTLYFSYMQCLSAKAVRN
jgi:hypothetical protein